MGKNLHQSWTKAHKTQHAYENEIQILITFYSFFVCLEFVFQGLGGFFSVVSSHIC
jgi:hypothetical protein